MSRPRSATVPGADGAVLVRWPDVKRPGPHLPSIVTGGGSGLAAPVPPARVYTRKERVLPAYHPHGVVLPGAQDPQSSLSDDGHHVRIGEGGHVHIEPADPEEMAAQLLREAQMRAGRGDVSPLRAPIPSRVRHTRMPHVRRLPPQRSPPGPSAQRSSDVPSAATAAGAEAPASHPPAAAKHNRARLSDVTPSAAGADTHAVGPVRPAAALTPESAQFLDDTQLDSFQMEGLAFPEAALLREMVLSHVLSAPLHKRFADVDAQLADSRKRSSR